MYQTKLCALAHIFKFYPSDGNGKLWANCNSFQKAIQPTLVICHSLMWRLCLATLSHYFKQPKLDHSDQKLCQCMRMCLCYWQMSVCQTTILADHERLLITEENQWNRVYLNSAKWFKVGQPFGDQCVSSPPKWVHEWNLTQHQLQLYRIWT